MKNIIHDNFFYDQAEKNNEREFIGLESVSMSFEDYLVISSSADNLYVDDWVNTELNVSKKYFIESLKDRS